MLINIYFIIGIMLLTWTSVRQWKRNREDMKSNLKNPLWWTCTVMCAILWPVLVGWAIIDAIQIIREEGL